MHASILSFFAATALCAGLVGYSAGRLVEDAPSTLSKDAVVDSVLLTSSDSFSEVDQARSNLDALCLRYISHAQRRMLNEPKDSVLPVLNSAETTPIVPESVAMLEDAAAGFRGTGTEPFAVRSLLQGLKRAQMHARWLEVYQDYTNRQPLEPLVCELAGEALRMAELTGRQSELIGTLVHLSRTPGPLQGRSQLSELLRHHPQAETL
jgi:hypothetical protein